MSQHVYVATNRANHRWLIVAPSPEQAAEYLFAIGRAKKAANVTVVEATDDYLRGAKDAPGDASPGLQALLDGDRMGVLHWVPVPPRYASADPPQAHYELLLAVAAYDDEVQ